MNLLKNLELKNNFPIYSSTSLPLSRVPLFFLSSLHPQAFEKFLLFTYSSVPSRLTSGITTLLILFSLRTPELFAKSTLSLT